MEKSFFLFATSRRFWASIKARFSSKSLNSESDPLDTNSSIISGVQQGILSEVKSIISDYKLQYPDIIAVVTGGDCFFFEKELKSSIFANPNLVLIGLNEILDFNG